MDRYRLASVWHSAHMALCCWAAPALQFPNLFVFNNGGGNDTVNGFTARVVSGDLLDVTDFGITCFFRDLIL